VGGFVRGATQESSLASVRLLHPTLYPMELVTASHDHFLTASDKVRLVVAFASSDYCVRSGQVQGPPMQRNAS